MIARDADDVDSSVDDVHIIQSALTLAFNFPTVSLCKLFTRTRLRYVRVHAIAKQSVVCL